MAGGYGSIAFMEREVLLRLLFPNTSGKSIVMTKKTDPEGGLLRHCGFGG
jgi:hypothetical protein